MPGPMPAAALIIFFRRAFLRRSRATQFMFAGAVTLLWVIVYGMIFLKDH